MRLDEADRGRADLEASNARAHVDATASRGIGCGKTTHSTRELWLNSTHG
jgi:hypothetical protein